MGAGGTILKTNNGGTTWYGQTSGVTYDLYAVCFTDSNNGYSVGLDGTILKTTNGGGLGVDEISGKSTDMNVYPNPASDFITVDASLIQTKCQLSILNLSGQELIARQITEPKTQIDISSLPSGVYFVRLTSDKTVSTGKFIKQ